MDPQTVPPLLVDLDAGRNAAGSTAVMSIGSTMTYPVVPQWKDAINTSIVTTDVPGNPHYVTLENATSTGYPDYPYKNIACMVRYNDNTQWSSHLPDTQNQVRDRSNDAPIHPAQTGTIYLLPNILEAKINLCVNTISTTSRESSYQYIVSDASNLDQQDTRLLPQFANDDTSSVNYPIADGTSLGTITYPPETKGTRCAEHVFYLKTKTENCTNFNGINPTDHSPINDDGFQLKFLDPNGNKATITLQPKVVIDQTNISSGGQYQLQLISDDGYAHITSPDGGTGDTINCPYGMCQNATITYNAGVRK